MRILESAPRRYELGIRLLTLGRVGRAYDRLASYVREGQRVLDLGCGPGACGEVLTPETARRFKLNLLGHRLVPAGEAQEGSLEAESRPS